MLLLLNLHVTIDKGSLNFECGRIMAQVWLEETLPEVVVIGSQYTTCTKCYLNVEKRYLQAHLEQDCPKRIVECGFCNQTYVFCNGHTCTVKCAICHKPASECTCDGCSCHGNNNSENSSGNSGNDTGSSGSGVGSGSSYNTDLIPSESGKKISVSDLKYKSGVKLVSYTKLPDKLYPQKRKMECVLLAYAFMAELKGYDYDVACRAMDEIAKLKRRNLKIEGIYPNELLTFFQDYCQIGKDYNKPSNVAFYINQGIPVAIETCTTPYHMVTIIGYDGDYYYTAAGDGNGDATIYAKTQLSCTDFLYFFNTTNIPYK